MPYNLRLFRYILRDIGETDMFMNFRSVPQTLGIWEPEKFTGENEEDILNRTITGLLLSAGQTNPQETFVQEESHMLKKRNEQQRKNTDFALPSEDDNEEEKYATPAHISTTKPLFVPTKKPYEPPQVHISNKESTEFHGNDFLMHRDMVGGTARTLKKRVVKSETFHGAETPFKTPKPPKHEHFRRNSSSVETPRDIHSTSRTLSDGEGSCIPYSLSPERTKRSVPRASTSLSKRSSGRKSGYLCRRKKANRKSDPVSRFHSTQRVWQKDSFLKRRAGRHTKSFTPSVPRRQSTTSGQRLSASPDYTPHRSFRSRPSVNNYVVPTSKKRERLRWEVRAQMLQQPEW